MTPHRIVRSRAKGWRLPEGAVCVTRPGRWGNPFRIGAPLSFPYSDLRDLGGVYVRDAAHAVALFAAYAEITCGYAELVRTELAGKDLACWCPLDQPCHADTLLQIATRIA